MKPTPLQSHHHLQAEGKQTGTTLHLKPVTASASASPLHTPFDEVGRD